MIVLDETDKHLKADIRIIGIGGGGNNALETMIQNRIQGVTFVAVNTDAQALSSSSAEIKIQLGEKLTKGLGAGANPEIGRRAAMESYEEIVEKIKGADMVFITAGMGGGTGSGGAPIVAEAAKDLGILTVGIVTYPFLFEGNRRKKYADASISELKKYVDTLITIPNEKLLGLSDTETSLLQSFKKTDEILLKAVKGIADLVSVKGLINLDFADVKTVMSDKGMALMSIGCAKGKNRAFEAVSQAISSPLLSDVSIEGSKGMIVNITAGKDLSLVEVNQALSCLTKIADSDADIIVGAVIDEDMDDQLSITLIATGFSDRDHNQVQTVNSLSQILKDNTSVKESSKQADGSIQEDSKSLLDSEEPQTVISEEPSEVISEEKLENQDESRHFTTEPHTVISEEPSIENQAKPKNDMSVKDQLLLKAKAYAKNEEDTTKDKTSLDHQISMDWVGDRDETEDTLDSSSPFESSIGFVDEDIS